MWRLEEELLIEYLAPVLDNKTKMAVCGNEDGLIGFLWINPSRGVQNCHTHTHTHKRLTITSSASNETVCVLCSIKQDSSAREEY